ncbi:hypothetical protein [Clostridium sp. LIBA-8841]|uniref:hypothetical protein n=1 Tax=Clostridium sp. LIBA-8841 TaxID=2987530 RepID=UPI002AC661F9|nr:hypothetical protein [Clostridium sp. LIBA-8841]MDZ5252895.1 hypothetical protein [Clostridium sp. LIBA-8841]
MKLKKWKNPNLTSLNVKETYENTFDYPHAWQCPKCGPTTATEGIDGAFRCDKCKTILGKGDWVGDGPHPS